ncbi:MAG: hypothetical protein ACRELE_00090, partial [Gemmatimonadales bacterium]
LTALEDERTDVALEVLVPERCGPGVRTRLSERFPWVTVLPVPSTTAIPDMRALAFDVAAAPSVSVIEDHVIVPRGWAHDLLLARETGQVIGGAVRNAATERLVDWAAFLCEYSQLLPPLPPGPSRWLTGNNTVYDRALLHEHRAATHAGRWESHLHNVLRDAGVELVCRPEIVVGHRKHYTVGEYLTQRYLYARSHAGAWGSGGHPLRRMLFGFAAFALPPLLFWRTVSRALSKRVPRLLVCRTVPLIALFVCAWGAGEVAGYWFGAGDSLSRVR